MGPVLFHGGTVVVEGRPVDALAVADGRIVAVGDDARGWCASWGTVVDLDGRALLPGFRDGHVHPLSGGTELVTLNLAGLPDLGAVQSAVGGWAASHPDDPWVVGWSYDPTVLPGGIGDAEWLDAVCPDRPVALYSADHHVMWVNSIALQRAGIGSATSDPPLGTILRRGDGTPVGTLLEWGAIDLVADLIPPIDRAARQAGLVAGMQALRRSGIVWAQDAAVEPDDVDVYVAGAHAGVLTCRINLAFRADPQRWVSQREAFVADRHRVESDPIAAEWLTARTVKFFADGVIEAGTGFLLEPYDDAPHSCGLPNWSPEGLAEAVRAFDGAGFQIHVHAIGDAGVRMALDAIELAIRLNGPRDRRPVIAHTQLVHPADRARFGALGVIANFEPLWSCLDDCMVELTAPRLGPTRTHLQYPIATLAALGAPISFGSDWPVSSLSPLAGLAVAVTRLNARGEPAGGWMPEERVPIREALRAYTAGSAYQAFDDDAGRLAVGQRADLCVVSTDITAVAGAEIAEVDVEQTWVGGVVVHRSDEGEDAA